MSKIRNLELMGWRELTEAEIGFLMTSRNYAGVLIISKVHYGEDLKLTTEQEAAFQ